MSEVTKRDKRVRLLSTLYATMKRDRDSATAAIWAVWQAQLSADWTAFEAAQDAVLDRAGVHEIDEQHSVYDEAYTYHYKASILLAELREKFELPIDEKAKIGAGAAATQAKIMADAAALREATAATRLKAELRHTTAFRRLQAMCQQIVNGVDDIQLEQLDAQRTVLEQLYAAYQEAGLEHIANGAAPDEVLADEADSTLLYLNAAGILKRIQQQHAAPQRDEPVINARDADALKMPHLNITPFDGKLAKWEAFRDSFVHGIHERANLPAVQKLQYLKSFAANQKSSCVISHSQLRIMSQRGHC